MSINYKFKSRISGNNDFHGVVTHRHQTSTFKILLKLLKKYISSKNTGYATETSKSNWRTLNIYEK